MAAGYIKCNIYIINRNIINRFGRNKTHSDCFFLLLLSLQCRFGQLRNLNKCARHQLLLECHQIGRRVIFQHNIQGLELNIQEYCGDEQRKE